MLTPRVVAEIEKWLVSPEGKDFAQTIIALFVKIGHPETLVKIGQWSEVLPFKRFLQETFKRSQRPGELKGCLERIDGIKVKGEKGREVAGIASGDDFYWSQHADGTDKSDESMRSWEDFFQTADPNCFLCAIFVKPSTENPGYTWVELKSCCDETGRISDYSFSCKDDKVSGVENGMRALGRRNQRVSDRPYFFAGDKSPIEIVDWKKLKIAGTAQEFFSRNLNRAIHVDCQCCFKDILVVDGDFVYSGLKYSEQDKEIRVIDRRYGDAKKFLTESKLSCWFYLLDWGEKGLFRLLAPKDEAKCDTASILQTLPDRIDVRHALDPVLPIYNSGNSGDWQWQRRIPDEEDFLKRFAEYCERAHYKFDERDIVRFHTGVKMGLVSLLAGEPGCGKSSLARLYANALSGSVQMSDKDSNFLRVFVSRNWITPYDMLGYPRRDAADIKPDGNGLLDFLRTAAEKAAEESSQEPESENVRCVCFEEMNLSQVEYYFSDFMQILSAGGTKDRDSLPGFGRDGLPLPIGDNLVFIGTCNNDATVRQFSARFLDRCNLVNLSSREDKGGFETSFADATIEDAVAVISGKKVGVTALRAWARVDQKQLDNLLGSEQNEFVEKLKPLFRIAGVPLDHRALKKMSQYVCCRPSINETASFKDSWLAFDEAVAQMVIPKLMLVNRNAVMGAKEIAKAMKAKFTSKGLQSDSSLTAYAIDRLVDVVRGALGVED